VHKTLAPPATTKPTFEYVEPDKLRFDPNNPRFSSTGTKDPEQIQRLLEQEPHLALELVDSFLENGFIDYEPLVVRREGDHFIVVEGNRRLAAVRHILANEKSYGQRSSMLDDLRSIPVLVFPEGAEAEERKQQRVYLGVRHLFGYRDWPPESKARFLDAQIKQRPDLQRTMRELNIKRSEIQRYVVPYRLRKSADSLLKPYVDQDFWVLGEALNRGGIKEYLGLEIDPESLRILDFDRKKLRNLLEFLYGVPKDGKRDNRRISETREISQLARVLAAPAAAAVLERGKSLEEAQLFIRSPQENRDGLRKAVQDLNALIKRLMSKTPKDAASKSLLATFEDFRKAALQFLRDGKKPRV